jgi:hypothetical protein
VSYEEVFPTVQGRADIILRRGYKTIVCQVTVTTLVEYEVESIRKCLNGNFAHRRHLNQPQEAGTDSIGFGLKWRQIQITPRRGIRSVTHLVLARVGPSFFIKSFPVRPPIPRPRDLENVQCRDAFIQFPSVMVRKPCRLASNSFLTHSTVESLSKLLLHGWRTAAANQFFAVTIHSLFSTSGG